MSGFSQLQVEGVTIQYAWRMPLATYTAIGGERAALGIRDVSSAEDLFDLMFGSRPKPPRAIKVTAGDSCRRNTLGKWRLWHGLALES
jgi:hypothetical protein